jgi:hypothetical protein
MRMVVWYMMVKRETGGAKEKEKLYELDAKKEMRVLSAMDVPVRVMMFSERARSVGDSAILVGM